MAGYGALGGGDGLGRYYELTQGLRASGQLDEVQTGQVEAAEQALLMLDNLQKDLRADLDFDECVATSMGISPNQPGAGPGDGAESGA